MSDHVVLNVTELARFTMSKTQGFFMTVKQILLNVYGEAPEIAKDLMNAISAFETVMFKEDQQTALVANADREADECWSALNALLKAMLISKNAMRREAAERINAVFSKYENPTRLPYNQEYAILQNLLSDLAGCDMKDLEACYLIEPIESLQDACNNFQTVVASTAESKAQIVIGENKEKRTALLDTWRKFVKRCNALAEWQNDPKLNDFIDQINVVIAQNNATYAAEKTRKAKA